MLGKDYKDIRDLNDEEKAHLREVIGEENSDISMLQKIERLKYET